MKESNLDMLEKCAKVMEDYGNHGAAFYIRQAIEELLELRELKEDNSTNL